MSIESDRERLSQAHNLEWIGRKLKATDMVTVYRRNSMEVRDDYFILSGLISLEQVEQVLSDTRIDNMEIESSCGMPDAFDCEAKDGKTQIKYLRYGNDKGIEPLIIRRSFSGIREDCYEISEEFRHFHDLYHDEKADKYIKIDDAGNEETVAIVTHDEVQIRLKEIRQFLAIKEMYLSILFEFSEYSTYSVEELGLNEIKQREFKREGFMCWGYDRLNTPNRKFRSDSRLRGRRLIEPLPKSKSGFGSFAEKMEQYAEFIIDVDEYGDEVCHTCNPYKLGDYPGENSDTAWKLTLVHFRKQVLDKYYNEPNKYNVSDSMVSCGLWSMKIDNHHSSDKVCVFLDHLGIHLPYAEQLHWRAYNIPPEGGMSETFYRRMVKGEWASSDQPDILFKQSYEQLQKACDEHLDWQLLKPLSSGDQYRFQRLRVPVNDEQYHFDDLVQDLQTILIESINVKGLKQLLPEAERVNLKDKRSIEILGEILSFHSVEDADHRASFLQKLQTLRSKGSGHRKGSDYQKIANYFGVDSLGQREAFAEILKRALDTIDFLTSVVHSGKLTNKSGKVE